MDSDPAIPLKTLIDKGTTLVKILSNDRKRVDTLRATQWDNFLTLKSGLQKAKWLFINTKDLIWQKKQSGKVIITKSFKRLIKKVQKLERINFLQKMYPGATFKFHEQL